MEGNLASSTTIYEYIYPFDVAIAFLGIILQINLHICEIIYTKLFIALMFLVVKNQKQTRCLPLRD